MRTQRVIFREHGHLSFVLTGGRRYPIVLALEHGTEYGRLFDFTATGCKVALRHGGVETRDAACVVEFAEWLRGQLGDQVDPDDLRARLVRILEAPQT